MNERRKELKAKSLMIEIKRNNLILDWMCGEEVDKDELLHTLRLFLPHMGIGYRKLTDEIAKCEKELKAIQGETEKQK